MVFWRCFYYFPFVQSQSFCSWNQIYVKQSESERFNLWRKSYSLSVTFFLTIRTTVHCFCEVQYLLENCGNEKGQMSCKNVFMQIKEY